MKCLFLVLILVSPLTVIFADEDDGDDFFHDVRSATNLVKLIHKFPKEYEKSIRAIANAIDMKNIFRRARRFPVSHEFKGLVEPHIEADNVTDLPTSVTEGSTTESLVTTRTIPTTIPTTVPPRISELCQNQSDAINQGINLQQEWAFRMIDAAGKPPSNILGGGTLWWGDYEECIAVKAFTNFTEIPYRFDGQYCKASVRGLLNGLVPTSPRITLGVCFPNSCGTTDIMNIMNDVFIEMQSEARVSSVVCQAVTKDIPFDTRAVIVLVVLGVFISVMALGTFYDLIFIQRPKWKQQEKDSRMNGEISVEASEKTPLLQEINVPVYRPGIAGNLLLSFSVYTNGAKILSAEQGKDVLTCINGIRFLSMTWVILGHTYGGPTNLADNKATFLPQMKERWTFLAVINAFPSVDSFFTLSGCLLTYLVMKELRNNNGKIKWGMFYFHRFWRLTPPYMLVLMVYVSLFHYSGSGPNWNKDGPERNHCEKAWYYNLLYVNNFVEERENQCMVWTWYLANDMQFFVLSPLILIPLYFVHLVGVGVLMVFLLGTWITTGVISTHYDYSVSSFDGGNTGFQKMYIKPYCRIGPYLVGMYTGYLLYKYNCKFRMNKFFNILGWTVATAAGLAVVYSVYDDINNERWSTEVAAFYNTVHRTVWGACVSWVIFACATGNGGFVNTILSWKGLIPLSRLSYMAYLTHMPVMSYFTQTQNNMIHLSDKEIIYEFLGHTVISYMIAFVTSLAFESPMMGLERVIFKRDERKG